MRAKPSIHCTPCRVRFRGIRYRIFSDGSAIETKQHDREIGTVGELREWEYQQPRHDPHSDLAQEVRREASRLRRNRNARERNQAMRDLGMTKTPYGWE